MMRKLPFGRFWRHTPAASADWIIAGLGNPGDRYDRTRHNVGFWVVDGLAARWHSKVNRLKFKSLAGDAVFEGRRLLLLKPQTFMNRSGEAVRECAAFYKVPWDRVIVVFDDVSLPPGRLRVRAKGSDGGHNGMKNILYHARTDVFPRVKIGVGAPPRPEIDLADWVLSGFSQAEYDALPLTRAMDAVQEIILRGPASAMNLYNSDKR